MASHVSPMNLARVYARKWRERNREHIRAYHKRWREMNRDRIRSYDKRPRKTARRVNWWNARY